MAVGAVAAGVDRKEVADEDVEQAPAAGVPDAARVVGADRDELAAVRRVLRVVDELSCGPAACGEASRSRRPTAGRSSPFVVATPRPPGERTACGVATPIVLTRSPPSRVDADRARQPHEEAPAAASRGRGRARRLRRGLARRRWSRCPCGRRARGRLARRPAPWRRRRGSGSRLRRGRGADHRSGPRARLFGLVLRPRRSASGMVSCCTRRPDGVRIRARRPATVTSVTAGPQRLHRRRRACRSGAASPAATRPRAARVPPLEPGHDRASARVEADARHGVGAAGERREEPSVLAVVDAAERDRRTPSRSRSRPG